jgi:hypothetical protein
MTVYLEGHQVGWGTGHQAEQALQVVQRSPRCDHAAPSRIISCGIDFCSLNTNELTSEYIGCVGAFSMGCVGGIRIE